MTKRSMFVFRLVLVVASASVLLLLPLKAAAKDIGADPPKCPTCPSCKGCASQQRSEPSATGTSISRTEGNLSERVETAPSAGLPSSAAGFMATYNSYNADGSRAQVDTVMGYGWTHSHNIFLFSQVGSMFRFDADGGVTRYKVGPGGTFTAAPGYFETLVKNPDGSFTLTQKDKTTYTFRLIPGTPFLVMGPVYRVTSMVDRNGNATTYTYTGGNLTSVTDTYGRTTTFTYTTFSSSNKKLSTVTDPAGRVTTYTYDPTGRALTAITDPTGRSTQYAYNTLYQLTSKTDKDGRTFTYTYTSNEPASVNDSSGAPSAHLSNPGNWATNATQLAMNQTRVYIPSTTTKTDGRGNVWRYDYNANGYITRITAPDGAATSYTYDASTLLVATTTDPRGNVTAYVYDARGNRTKVTDALGHITTYTYEPTFNQLTSMTDPRGRTTTFTIDPLTGNLLQEINPLGGTRSYTYDIHGNVTSATNENGQTTTNTYDSFGNLATTTDPLDHTTSMTYDPVGDRLSRTDALGRTTSWQYDGMSRVIKVTDPLLNTVQAQYDGEGNRTQIINRRGHTTLYHYDLRLRLITMTDAVGNSDHATFDGNDRRTSLLDRNGHLTTYQYDVQNRLTHTTDALGNTARRTYDPAGNVASDIDANAHATTYTYDALNRRITATDALGNVAQVIYDTGTRAGCPTCGITPGSGAVTGLVDGNGKATYFKFDALDRLIDVVRKVGSTADTIAPTDALTSYTYDPNGNRLSQTVRCTPCSTDPIGNTTLGVYDADNRRIKMTNPAGDITLVAYDAVDNAITITSPNGNVTSHTYDALDRLTQTVDGGGTVSLSTYDPNGNPTTQTDGNGHSTDYTYDSLDRRVSATDPLGHSTLWAYDRVGNLIQMVDRNGNATTYAYDAVNRRTSTTNALSNVTATQYDAVGNRTQLTDANGHATQYQYDPANRMIRETYANGTTQSFQYDAVGNVIRRTDGIGQVTTFAYDDLYDLTGRSYPSLVNDTFTYDLAQRMLTAQRGAWPDVFAYDAADRIVQSTQNGRVVSYAYNIAGRTRTLTYPGGRTIVEHTDLRGRTQNIDDASPSLVQYIYDAGDRIVSRTYRNGTTTAFTYNPNDWITALQHSGGSPFATFNYAYDNEGNKGFEEKVHDPLKSEQYQYDVTNRLIGFTVGALSGTPPPSTQTSYNLDPVGNWTSKTTNGVMENRTHGVVNELTQIDATSIPYDADGNPTSDATLSYAYDEENRLVRITRSFDGAIWQYQYDALGRRVAKAPLPPTPASTTLYFYDLDSAVEEQDGSGATRATYVFGGRLDDALVMDRGGTSYFYHENGLGSIEAVTNNVAAVVERYAYDAYGKPTITTGTGVPVPTNAWGSAHSAIGNPLLFTAREFDEESGLFFYRARTYDSSKGRFLQRDPLDYADSSNLYEYVRSRPTYFVDPLGLAGEAELAQALAAYYDQRLAAYLGGSSPEFMAAVRALVYNRVTPQSLQAARAAWANEIARRSFQGLSSARPGGGGGASRFAIGPIGGLLIWGTSMYALLDDLNDRFEELEQFKKHREQAELLRRKLEPFLKPCCQGDALVYVGPVAGSAAYGRDAVDEKGRPYWIPDCEYQWRLRFKDHGKLPGENYSRAWWLSEPDTLSGPRITSLGRPWTIDWSDRSAPKIVFTKP